MKQSLFKLETHSKSIHEPCSSNNKGSINEEQRLPIKELDEWRTQKSRTHDKPKPRHDGLNVLSNQLKVGDKVLLDAADPRICTSEPNGAIPFSILNIFPYGTVESSMIPEWFSSISVVQFRLGDLVRQLSVPEFGVALRLHTEDFMNDDDFDSLHRHIHYSPSNCWKALLPTSATNDPSHCKALALAPSLTYLHAILAHTLIGQMSSQGILTEQEDPEDITDDVPPPHEDPPSQPPPIHRPVHAATSLSDISECLTRFEQQFMKSSKAHYYLGICNSTRKGPPRLPCPVQSRP
ncbi:hypothetical protein GOBAR_AA10227 [Gossypium barbadense]|uniref:Uncharacterized protein n=1 Tax=Gossypium barbadense TaxID=3634 RepID=A0A2P5Y4C2_GOSBA|nr:hypothetical protein GOBAR_AA10227 [Gossypium barbadense]